MKNVSDKICREKQSINSFFSKSCTVWDSVENYGRVRQATDDNIIQHINIVCWITKATDTHSEYVIFIVLPREQWLYESTLTLH
jgi:hypothetical protein